MNAWNDPARFVGRFVELSNCGPVSGTVGCINSYNIQNDNYEVEYRVNSTTTSINVQPSQIQLFSPEDFVDLYPNAPVVKGSYSMDEVPVRTVVDFSEGERTTLHPSPPFQLALNIRGSCRLIDRSSDSKPLHKFTGGVIIDTANADDIVEFENIRFEPAQSNKFVRCVRGKIVFRNCTFSGNDIGVLIDNNVTGGKRFESIMVTFESCCFCGVKECSVLMHGGLVRMVNCVFEIGGVGISTSSGASAHVHLSTFSSCMSGVVVPTKGQMFLTNCTFEGISDFCVLIGNESDLDMKTCTMNNCAGDGVVIEGDNSNAIVKDCTITGCRYCVRIGNGLVHVTLRRLIYRDYKIIGIYIAVDTKGIVDISESPMGTFRNMVIDLSGDRCAILRKGREMLKSDQLLRLQKRRALTELEGFKYGYPVSAMGKRILHRNGIVAMHCIKCKRTAPPDELYRKCAGCHEARYCSKACQREHWKTHFVECRLLWLRSNTLRACGYINCKKCGSVENHGSEKRHSACRRCLKVFYCDRECQTGHWAQHKLDCKPYAAK